MKKQMKFVATVATVLIAAAGVITFEACNKTDKTSLEPTTIQNNGKPLAAYDHNQGTMTYSFDLDKINADLNRSMSKTDENRYIVESVEILDEHPLDLSTSAEVKIVLIDTEEEKSESIWLMKKFSEKEIDEDRTYYYLEKNVSTGNYDFAYRYNNRLFVVNVNGDNISINEKDTTIVDRLPRWLLYCTATNCSQCTKNGSFWNAGCVPCENSNGSCTSGLADWVVPVITTLITIILA